MNSKQKRIAKQLENQRISPDRLRKNMDAKRHPDEKNSQKENSQQTMEAHPVKALS